MFDEILKVANRYDEGLTHVRTRREQWLDKYEMLRDHLKKIADHLNENAQYKQGFFVDTLRAYNEDINGTSSRMPSVTFRSGSMPMLVTFRNSMGEKKAYTEEGFSISFNPTITGQVVVLLQPHYSDLDKEQPELSMLAAINDPAEITEIVIDSIIAKGMEVAFYSSFTGMDQNPQEETETENSINKRNQIGFRRHDTTEKIE
jgi:hypothetical protein